MPSYFPVLQCFFFSFFFSGRVTSSRIIIALQNYFQTNAMAGKSDFTKVFHGKYNGQPNVMVSNIYVCFYYC